MRPIPPPGLRRALGTALAYCRAVVSREHSYYICRTQSAFMGVVYTLYYTL